MRSEFYWETEDGVKLYGQEWVPEQNGKGLVCLVHGLGEHSGRYNHVADYFAARGYILVSFDLRGHGRSEGKRGDCPSFQRLLCDIAAFLQREEKRFPQQPLFLYGHSLGGNLVLNYVLRQSPPLKGVVVTSPWLCLSTEPSAWLVKLVGALNKVWPGFAVSSDLNTASLSRDPSVAIAYKQDELVHSRISARLFTEAYRAGLWALDNAEQFKPPLLLMHGTGDRITLPGASEQFAAALGDSCDLILWEGLYHELHNEPEQQEVLDCIARWLGQHS